MKWTPERHKIARDILDTWRRVYEAEGHGLPPAKQCLADALDEIERLREMLERAMVFIQSPNVVILGEAWSQNYKEQVESRSSLNYDYATMKGERNDK